VGDSPLTSDALIKHRDGIVGPWQGANLPVEMPPIDTKEQLWKWESWCRGAALDFELGADFKFAASGTDTATLSDAGGKEIVTLTRPSLDTFKAQLDLVESYADLREDRGSEILAQIGLNSDFWGMMAYLQPARCPKTFEVLLAALRMAISVEMRFKHALACPRPIEYSPQVQPMIQTPGHGSLPSGHSTQAFMIGRVFWELLPAARRSALMYEELMRQAARIAVNRTVAGVHFPVDSVAGRILGTTLAEYFVGRVTKVPYTPRRFVPAKFDKDSDFKLSDGIRRLEPNPAKYVELLADQPAAESAILGWIWQEAQKEWRP
jgi:hypothetical protein